MVQPDPPTPRSPEPLFLALGRLAEYKRLDLLLRLWDRVRQVVGGKLVIAGDGPERARLEALAGPGVVFTGRVSEQEKHRLLCSAWLLMHPALIEGWGIVVSEAAIRGTPAVAFDVPGLRDSVVHGETGMLVRTEGQFASAWASLAIDGRRREALGRAARTRALQLHWSAAVEGFAEVADEAIKRAAPVAGRSSRGRRAGRNHRGGDRPTPGGPLQAFYSTRASRSARARTGPGARPGCWPGCCASVAGPAVIVDVGCGDGTALAVAAGQNPAHRFAGIDWSGDALRQARKPSASPWCARTWPAPGLPVADGAADVVIMSELIEHLVDPDGAVAEARRVLRPGGSLLLSTPNLAAWYNRGLLAAGIQPVFSEVSLRGVFGRPGRVVAGHLRLFTRRALTEFLTASGFGCVTVAGARYHDVPRPLRPLDRAFCRWPAAASILLVHARKE